MVRGKFIFVLDTNTYIISEEFNGGMYIIVDASSKSIIADYHDLNNAIISILEKFKEQHHMDFKEQVDFALEIIRDFHNKIYPEENLVIDYIENNEEEYFFDFQREANNGTYFKNWFSDHLYLINIGTEPVKIRCETKNKKGKKIVLKPKTIVDAYYGAYNGTITRKTGVIPYNNEVEVVDFGEEGEE